MQKFSSRAIAFAIVLVVTGVSARAQYGAYGWAGWGAAASGLGAGTTAQGSIATGMGNLAVGMGEYNVQTAQARAVNANTAMQWNNYAYQVNVQNSANEIARLNRRQAKVKETADATYRRLHDAPTPHDIHSGDALNVVLTELANPAVYTRVVEKSAVPIASVLVKAINFQHAANMVAISLDDISARGVPDVLAKAPEFAADRQAIRAIVAKGREEAQSEGLVSKETLLAFRAAVKAAQAKVSTTIRRGTPERSQADNYLKALFGLSRMLERPEVERLLEGLNRYPSTTLGQVVSFMHSFNLRFGPAKNPQQEAAYDQIYPMLVQLRDQAQAKGSNPMSGPATLPDPKAATSVFSAIEDPQGDPGSNPPGRPVPTPPKPR